VWGGSNNVLKGNKISSQSSGPSIYILDNATADADDNEVSNNRVSGTSASYSLQIGAGSTNTLVRDNSLGAGATGTLLDSGTTSNISGTNGESFAVMSMTGQSTEVASVGSSTWTKIAGTTASEVAQDFTITTTSGGRLTYTGVATKKFLCDFKISLNTGTTWNAASEKAYVTIAKGGTPDVSQAVGIHMTGSPTIDGENIAFGGYVQLATDEYVEIYFMSDGAAGNDLVATDGIFTIRGI
jgi:hypothetical protein